jgi:ATP-dependent Clp protease protease subunit
MLEIYTREILLIRDRLYEILARHTGQDIERIKKDSDRDFFMSAEEAQEYGIVDKVIESREEIEAKKK